MRIDWNCGISMNSLKCMRICLCAQVLQHMHICTCVYVFVHPCIYFLTLYAEGVKKQIYSAAMSTPSIKALTADTIAH